MAADGVIGIAAGLCESCAHARRLESARGSVFVLCGKSREDGRYPKYPRLPVISCGGRVPAPVER